MMTALHPSHRVDQRVHLKVDIPELGLHSGDSGSICARWFQPFDVLEVSFAEPGSSFPIRALLIESQIESDEPAQLADA